MGEEYYNIEIATISHRASPGEAAARLISLFNEDKYKNFRIEHYFEYISIRADIKRKGENNQ